MKTEIVLCSWRNWGRIKGLALFLTACLGLACQSADAAAYHLVHPFEGGKNDGRTPTFQSSLTLSGPYFYGITLVGGQYTNGVLFQIQTNGTGIKIVHTFNGWAVLNMGGSKSDGALPIGTPVLDGTTLYGMTQQGGSNGFEYGQGTVFSVQTDGSNFQVLHSFGALNDGSTPVGSLILSGSTLYGMTEEGGTNGISEGTIFSIGTDGGGYQVLHSFINDSGSPQGSLLQWGATLYGMTAGEIFEVATDGSSFLPVHVFAGAPGDGSDAFGSVIRSGSYLYGMTFSGGENNVGTVFQLQLIGSRFQLLHSFALDEAFEPYGDLVLSGATLYGMTYGGVTNYDHDGDVGSGAVFEIETNGEDYQVLHTFEFPLTTSDGSLPFGTPIVVGSELYGMTSLGGSSGLPLGTKDGGCIFSLTLAGASGSGGSGPPAIATTSPLPLGNVGVVYSQQLAASGGETPYAWSVSAGHLPKGLTLSASGLLGGKPTAGGISDFTIKVTGHNKMSSTQAFILTVEAPPVLTITDPKSNMKVTTPTFDASGKAVAAVTVAGVYFQLNGGAWTEAQTGDGFTLWNYPNLPLLADTNTFSAYALDNFGNDSKTNTVKFIYYATTTLTVKTNGSGSFTPNDNGKKLQVGATFSMTAKAAKGFVFTNWTDGSGDVLTNGAKLTFVMASNLTLIANFTVGVEALARDADAAFAIPVKSELRPFQGVSGNYYGLFAPPKGTRQNTNSGAIRLTLSESGSFSGKLLLGPDAAAFGGRFDLSGATRILIARNGKKELTAALQLDLTRQALTGEVTDGSFVASVGGYRNGFDANQRAMNFQGKYAVSIPALSDAGAGSGVVAVDALGNVTFEGTLPDGQKASQTSLVSRDGYWPLYVALYGGRGSLWGWSRFVNGTVSSLPASADWITSTNGVESPMGAAGLTNKAVEIIAAGVANQK